jgi:hypothetical protein
MEKEKTPDVIKDFVMTEFTVDKEKIVDLTDDGLKKFVESKTDLFQRVSKNVNPEFDVTQESGDKKGGSGDAKKADYNELLDEDLDV